MNLPQNMKSIVSVLIVIIFLLSCTGAGKDESRVIIFHAGSLSVPLKQMEKAFEEQFPGIDVRLEGAGSVACARKITDLNRDCDIMASADYTVIDKMLIPEYTSNNIRFANNEMVIAFSDRSERAAEISAESWPDILMDEDVIYGRSDPDSDPCGYRSLMTMKLSDKYYGRNDISESLLNKDRNMIRPKEVDLVALLQTGVIDYFFIYRSVAEQHKLSYIELPPEINLSSSDFNDIYSEVSVEIKGKSPGETIEMRGGEMTYGITILDNSKDREPVIEFMKFFLGEQGRGIIVKNGQREIYPPLVNNLEALPLSLHHFFSIE